MTELEYLASNGKINYSYIIFGVARVCKYGVNNCKNVLCSQCEFDGNIQLCLEVLLAEHKEKIKLTKNEKAILESVDKEYKWIARDNNGELYVYINEPYRVSGKWEEDYDYRSFNLFKHLFKSIKCEDDKAYNIQELLANCEVEER